MDGRHKTTVWIAIAALVALVLGGGAAWLVRSGEVDSLRERVAELEAEANAPSADQSETVESTLATAAVPSAAEERPTQTGPTEHQPGIVKAIVNDAGTWRLTIDYVQFLTGADAARVAAERGEESPPPNDYYVVNDNPRLREFPVQAGIGVIVVINDDGTSDPSGHSLTLSQWAAAMSGTHAEAFGSTLYWVTVTNGTVTAIQAIYTP